MNKSSSSFGWKTVFEGNIGKRLFVLHDEVGDRHGVVLRILSVGKDIVEGETDSGVRQWLHLSTVLKVKVLEDRKEGAN